jgi:hypothetical protein
LGGMPAQPGLPAQPQRADARIGDKKHQEREDRGREKIGNHRSFLRLFISPRKILFPSSRFRSRQRRNSPDDITVKLIVFSHNKLTALSTEVSTTFRGDPGTPVDRAGDTASHAAAARFAPRRRAATGSCASHGRQGGPLDAWGGASRPAWQNRRNPPPFSVGEDISQVRNPFSGLESCPVA